MKMVCRQPLLISPVDSAQPTLPAGYSPPIPIPTYRNLRSAEPFTHGTHPPPHPRTHRRTHKESPGGEDVEHADGVAVVVRSGGEGGEDDQDDGRHHQRAGARPVVREVAKGKLADDSAGEGDGADDLLGLRVGPGAAVLQAQDRPDRADDLN